LAINLISPHARGPDEINRIEMSGKDLVRMRGFSRRTSVDAFLKTIREHCAPGRKERINALDCPGYGLAEDVVSPVDIPGFDRSAMDGFALKGEETFGAGPYNPLSFDVIGQVTPGRVFDGEIGKGEAVRIMTGAPLPKGANAVLMAEYAEQNGARVEVMQAVAPGKNVGKVGEDIRVGEVLFKKGRTLRVQDAAVLCSAGIDKIEVWRRPTVDILITGNEIVPPGEKPQGVNIVDANSVLLRHLIKRDGGAVGAINYLPDRREVIRQALQDSEADIVCI